MDTAISTVTESSDPVQFAVAAAAILVDEKKLDQADKLFARLEKQMKEAARMMEYEYAAVLRDQIIQLRGNGI